MAEQRTQEAEGQEGASEDEPLAAASAEQVTPEASEGEEGQEEVSASELKAQGNEAYRQQDAQRAVDLWNRALRAHVESMRVGGPSSSSPLSPESVELERSLYLNLAQGYLKLGDPARALRACQVVLREYRDDPKARYRAAEACLALGRLDEARACLATLLRGPDAPPEAARLMLRVKAEIKAAVEKDRQAAKRMLAAAEGLAEDRQKSSPSTSRPSLSTARLAEMDPMSIASGADLAEAAAKAALAREARLAGAAARTSVETGPQPVVGETDLDAFRARVMAKSSKYTAHMDKSRRKRDNAQHSLKLSWLRGGREASGFEGFAERWRDELREAEAQAEVEAAGAAVAGECAGGGEGEAAMDGGAVGGTDVDGAGGPEAEAEAAGGGMEEMD